MEIDLSGILTLVIEALAGLLLAVGTWAAKRFAEYMKLEADSEVRAYLQEAIERAVDYGAELAKDRGELLSSIEVRDSVVARATNYLLYQVPDALDRFGIEPESLRDMVKARMWRIGIESE